MTVHASARERTTHDSASKPRASLPARPAHRSVRERAADRAETRLLSLVGRLQADIAANPAHRAAHGYYANGCCAMLEALGIVSAERIVIIRQACNAVLDGALGVQEVRTIEAAGGELDARYLRAISLVRRAGQANHTVLADQLSIGQGTALRMIERMTREGIVSEPDMFGTRKALAVEVRHG